MRISWIIALIILLACSACSVKVTPLPTETGTINPEDQSITEVRNGVAFNVKLDALHYAPYLIVDNITTFEIAIDNRNEQPVSYPTTSFILKDGNGQQYRSITPERVREIVSKDTVYLIPYPYVGYYYLKDQATVSELDAYSSEMPFYAEYRPQEIFTRALPEEPVLANAKVSGLVYFIADLEKTDYAEVLVFPGGDTSGEPLAKFPFAIGQ